MLHEVLERARFFDRIIDKQRALSNYEEALNIDPDY